MENPYITCIECIFILKTSIDSYPESILRLYKDRDKAEKFIRSLKESLEIRLIRIGIVIQQRVFSSLLSSPI
ncbi:MAG: hypothetical protein QXH07_02180 [Thermoplasmata archaeon]